MDEAAPTSQETQWTAFPELHFIAWGFVLNGAWEALQSPLYTDHARGLSYLLRTRLHCTLADTLVVLVVFWVTCALSRNRAWWVAPHWVPVFLFVALGLVFTAGSEWFATRVRFTWEYAPAMPLVLGLGLSPLLQWLVVPPAVLALARRTGKLRRRSP